MRTQPGALAALLAAFPSSSLAASSSRPAPQTTVTLWIPSSQPLPNPHVLPSSTHATLTALGVAQDAPLTAAGTFVFRNVTPGSYLADVYCGTHAFAPLRVDVLPSLPGGREEGGADGGAEEGEEEEKVRAKAKVRAWETFRGNDWENKGAEVPRVADSEGGRFAVRALGPKEYFVERGSFSVLGILKNPMILMGLVSMVLFVGMPKLVENMDPEMRAEWEAQQRKNPMNSLMSGPQPGANPMGNFDMAAYLAGQGNKNEGEPSSAGNGGGASKKGGKR
ncbi:Homocysteine/cysteine synthase [Parahypoxylon ruwenzoriense]